MSFPLEILRSGIKTADGLTKGVQGTITLEQCITQDGRGKRTYATGIPVHAVIDLTRKERAGAGGLMTTIIASLTILEAVPANGTVIAGHPRQEPIDPRDRITLPDGRTGPIVGVPGAVLDPGTGYGLIQSVEIGELSA